MEQKNFSNWFYSLSKITLLLEMSPDYTTYIAHIDLTRLEQNNSTEQIIALCRQAQTVFGNIAAVCIPPEHVTVAVDQLQHTTIKVATVANFPTGNQALKATQQQIDQAIAAGANEIDLVMPYQALQNGQHTFVQHYLASCRQQCQQLCLKVILETGSFTSEPAMLDAALLAIDCGADFLKTSTGKIAIGASLQAAAVLCQAIQSRPECEVGIKLSGGIKDPQTAQTYWQQITQQMGATWISPKHLRFGASSLLTTILNQAKT